MIDKSGTLEHYKAQVAALTAERDELSAEWIYQRSAADRYHDQLAASQADNARLREALRFYMTPPIGQLNDHHIKAAKMGMVALKSIVAFEKED